MHVKFSDIKNLHLIFLDQEMFTNFTPRKICQKYVIISISYIN